MPTDRRRAVNGAPALVRRWARFLDWSLRAKLATLLVIASALPLALAAFVDVRLARQHLLANTAAVLAARGDELVGELDAFNASYRISARRFARLPALVEFCRAVNAGARQQSLAARATLQAQPDSDPSVASAGLLDLTGTVTAATEPALVGKHLDFHAYVREALRGPPVISELQLAETELGRVPSIAFTAPVLGSDQRAIGFVVLWVKASALWDIARASNARAGPGSFAVLFDHAGIRIGHTYNDEIVFHPAGIVAPHTIDSFVDEQRFGADTRRLLSDVRPFPEQFERARSENPAQAVFRGWAPVNQKWNYGVGRRLKTVSWTAFYMIPEATLTAQIANMTRQKALFAAAIILVALLSGGLLAGFIVRPVALLTNATELLASGDLSARVRITRTDELGRLAASFDAMAARIQTQAGALQSAHDHLELAVRQRTAELSETTQALRESEESLATTLNSIGDGVIATDAQGQVTRMNPVAQGLTGWSLSEARGKPLGEVFRILNEDTRAPVESPVERVIRDGVVVGLANHTVLVARDGATRPIADSGAPIYDANGSLSGVVLVFRDQTLDRDAERALQESDARKGAILEAALDCIVSMDANGVITEFNPAAERTFGYARARAMGQPLVELLIPPALRTRHVAGVRRYLDTGVGPVLGKRVELQALHADGTEFPIELAVVRTRSDGAPTFTAYIRDITDRRRAAEALEVSEARFKHLAESGIIGILIADTLGNIHEANDEFLRIIGYSRDDLASGVVRGADRTPAEYRARDQAALQQLKDKGVASPYDKEYVRKDGTRAPVLIGAVALAPPRCLAFVLDLSELKRAQAAKALALAAVEAESGHRERAEEALRDTERQLRQSQKMEAVGALAGSVAHDFNNLLSVILGYAEMLIADLQGGDPMREDIEEMARAAARGNDLTRQLLAFSRQQVLQPKPVNVNDAIAGMTRMLQRIIREDIELEVLAAATLGTVFVDPGQLEQVLLNLVVNARDAMPGGGKLTIETADVELDRTYAALHPEVEPGRFVMLSVSDTGFGMDRATQARIFEPFFTTKEMGKGTGLGLSTVFGIVKQSGGSVWVYSEVGVGTSFKIYLPRSDAVVTPSQRSRPSGVVLRGSETILLVEDDEQVRHLAVSILRRHGYEVLEAASGGDALLICERHQATIHALLTDVVMPRMSGRELWQRLVPLRPAMKVLFMSGYTDDAIVHHGVLSSELAFVQKPLMPGPLLAKLRAVLDDGEGASGAPAPVVG